MKQPGNHVGFTGGATGRQGVMLLFLALAFSLGLSWHFFTTPLRPWPDQGWTLQAAVRHAHGDGLTSQISSAANDLTEVSYPRLSYFPPLYPLLVSGLLQTGLTVEAVVKGVNAAALLIGTAGWMSLAIRYLRTRVAQALFPFLLVLAAGAAVPKGGTTDYILWAAMPYWLVLLLAGQQSESFVRALLLLVADGALVSGLIGVRWASLFLVPAGGLVLLLPGRRGFFRRCVCAAVYGFPAVAAYLGITALNRSASGSAGSLLAYLTPKWEFFRLATPFPLESLTTIPLGVEPLVKRLWRAGDPSLTSPALALACRVLVPQAVLAVFLWAWQRWRRALGGADRDVREFAGAFGVTGAALVAFLGYLSVRYTWAGVDWSYLDEPRYFRPLWPMGLLMGLAALDRGEWPRTLRAAGLGLLAVAGVYLLQAQARWEYQRLTNPDESWELVQQVRGLADHDGLQVVCDIDVSDYLVTAPPNLIAIGYPGAEQVPHLKVSRPADLWLVRRVNESTAYMLDPDFDARRFRALSNRFPAKKVWTSSRGNYELYHARIGVPYEDRKGVN
jgi:hypothetical protein